MSAGGEHFEQLGEHFLPFRTGKEQGELGVKEAELHAEIVASASEFAGKIFFTHGKLGKSRGEREGSGGAALLTGENFHDFRGQHVHPKKAEIMPRAKTRNDQFLLCNGGGWFLENFFNLVEFFLARYPFATDRAIVREHSFARWLNGGDGTSLALGCRNELLGARFGFVAEVKMIADEVKKCIRTDKIAGAQEGMAIAKGFSLLKELDFCGATFQGSFVLLTVIGREDEANLVDAGAEHLVKNNANGRFLISIGINQHLQRQPVLIFACRCNDRFFNIHLLPGRVP